MQDIAFGMGLALLIIMQWFMIWECIRMRSHVSTQSTDLRTEMGNLGTLLDEALDFIAENVPPSQGIVGHTLAQPDIKEVLLNGFLSRMMSPSENGPLKEEWTIRQNDSPPTLETESESN